MAAPSATLGQNRTSGCLPAPVYSTPSSLPGPELAWECKQQSHGPVGFPVCGDNGQEFKKGIRSEEWLTHRAGGGNVRCRGPTKLSWLETVGFFQTGDCSAKTLTGYGHI